MNGIIEDVDENKSFVIKIDSIQENLFCDEIIRHTNYKL